MFYQISGQNHNLLIQRLKKKKPQIIQVLIITQTSDDEKYTDN